MTKITRIYGNEPAQQFSKVDLEPYKNPKRNIYEVTVKHMHGDADYYTTDVHDFKNQQKMLKFVNFLMRCMAAYPNGMGGEDRFDHIDGFSSYEHHLHRDNQYYDGHATPISVDVVYYDGESVKWDAIIS